VIEAIKLPQDFFDSKTVGFIELVNPAVKEARTESPFKGLRESETLIGIRISYVPSPPGRCRVHVPIKDPEFRVGGALGVNGLQPCREH